MENATTAVFFRTLIPPGDADRFIDQSGERRKTGDANRLTRPGMTVVVSALLRRKGIGAMAIYREKAINDMVGTIEDAMRQVLDCWAELPPEMQDAVDQFRVQLGAAIDSVYLVKRALDQEVHESEKRLG